MGISKMEVNLRRLLAAAPQQQNQAKLVHYVAILREQFKQLAEEKTPEGLPKISKATINEYLEKIEANASKLVNFEYFFEWTNVKENYSEIEAKKQIPLSPLSFGLRRRSVPVPSFEDRLYEPAETGHSLMHTLKSTDYNLKLVMLDFGIAIVVLAKQLKESSLMMNQSLQNTEKV
ncbi:uncharacterized protein LOC130939947 [Arachis stenosperma]|uniref:uncharacterized protein LOC130939947 n=1 Tax=Arachis stenosperma TaxID=217475 RepID=UPI0025AD8A4B|nr:uncharacterized protein LOC130939947 [Arachis stenosperma]